MKRKPLAEGYVQIYTGDGKGKTTAALGLALRASGHGLRTYIGQFMKGQRYGELEALSGNAYITVEQYGEIHHIYEDSVTSDDVERAQRGLELAREAMLSGRYDILVLDEIAVAIWFGLIETQAVLALLDERPADVEVVLTGRRAPQELIDRADLVTEMVMVKHYYEQGVNARRGIER